MGGQPFRDDSCDVENMAKGMPLLRSAHADFLSHRVVAKWPHRSLLLTREALQLLTEGGELLPGLNDSHSSCSTLPCTILGSWFSIFRHIENQKILGLSGEGPVFECASTRRVVGHNLPVTKELVLVSGEALQTHGAAGVELAGAYAKLGSQPISEPVGEPR